VVRVDSDNIDAVLAKYAPSVVLGAEHGHARLEFGRFDDFHPDTLVRNAQLFGRMLDLRSRLQQPGTFASAAAELGAGLDVEPHLGEAKESQPATSSGAPDEAADTLERLLGSRTGGTPSSAERPRVLGIVDNLVRQAVAPHVVAAGDPRLPQWLSAVDDATSGVMRGILHDPHFQEVESTWRGLHWLVSSLELGETLELHLLHVTRDELSAGAGARSTLLRRLVDREAQMSGGLELSAIVAAFRFGATMEDLAALESLGLLASDIGAPLVAECGPGLLGSRSVAEQPDPRDWTMPEAAIEARWRGLRAGSAASRLGLVLPRLLLRLPYGRKSDPIEAFAFEEIPAVADHDAFLWGNAAFAAALVIARLLDPDQQPPDAGTITGLPAFVLATADGPGLQPCAEVCLTERAVQAVLARGVMPLVSVKNADVVRLVRLQSIADPPTPLLG
jgi:type VI secretion system protein ImpC